MFPFSKATAVRQKCDDDAGGMDAMKSGGSVNLVKLIIRRSRNFETSGHSWENVGENLDIML